MMQATSDVLVLSTERKLSEALSDHAREKQWRMEQIDSIGDALRALRQRQPRAAILPVWLSGLSDLTKLISELRDRRPDVPVIAVNDTEVAEDDVEAAADAEVEDEQIERSVRAAGATCYVSLAHGVAELNHIVESLQPVPEIAQRARPTVARGPSLPKATARGRPPPRSVNRLNY